eukprot:CAMPEP_0181499658 /NCGR_PEP_ID=MMETSP1110-20121109/54780_1 /TAXON_ID=174948 /ORGANISM="Symbiodinium sp., Strain CCMP421" /LENGTH=124 /DNA_ID=CAMNT_0023627867 /DNA_START=202 /DNA_END=572 /DNA_ORIENTATION=-
MADEGVCIDEARVQLDGSLEALDGEVVLVFDAVAIAHHAPGLRALAVLLQNLVGQIAQLQALPQMPQGRGVVLQAPEGATRAIRATRATARIPGASVDAGRGLVVLQLEVAPRREVLAEPGALL